MEEIHWECLVDTVTKAQWQRIVPMFKDGNIYQTWSYGAIHWGERSISHVLLERNGDIVAAAQARILKIPILRVGIAYVTCGPLWRRKASPDMLEFFSRMMEALRYEYVIKRGLCLRVLPIDEACENDCLKELALAAGFSWSPNLYHTAIMDLTHSLDELRASLRAPWRRCLSHAEKSGLVTEMGTDDELYSKSMLVYDQMLKRKGFATSVDMKEFGRIQSDLPEDQKMKNAVCYQDGEPVAALACSLIGDSAFAVMGATGDNALKTKTSALNLLYWEMVKTLKGNGATSFDLAGIDRETNPGGYTWKTDLSGKLGREASRIGQFDAWNSWTSRLVVLLGDKLREGLRKARLRKARLRKTRQRIIAVPQDKVERGSACG